MAKNTQDPTVSQPPAAPETQDSQSSVLPMLEGDFLNLKQRIEDYAKQDVHAGRIFLEMLSHLATAHGLDPQQIEAKKTEPEPAPEPTEPKEETTNGN